MNGSGGLGACLSFEYKFPPKGTGGGTQGDSSEPGVELFLLSIFDFFP
jgi:hypothetical protein